MEEVFIFGGLNSYPDYFDHDVHEVIRNNVRIYFWAANYRSGLNHVQLEIERSIINEVMK